MLLILITGHQAAGKSKMALELKDALSAFRPGAVVEIIDDQHDQRPADYADATIVVAQEKPAWVDAFPDHLHFFAEP